MDNNDETDQISTVVLRGPIHLWVLRRRFYRKHLETDTGYSSSHINLLRRLPARVGGSTLGYYWYHSVYSACHLHASR